MATRDVVEGAALSPGQGDNLCASRPQISVGPANLGDRVDYYQSRLEDEIQPRTTLESICVSELARHAAGMELGSLSEAATLKFAAETAAAVHMTPDPGSLPPGLVAAVTSELMVRASRYTARHVRGFHAALAQLRECSMPALIQTEIFVDEDDCTRYLYQWQQQQPWTCPGCGSSERCCLRSRARLECRCGRQFSVRRGTAFEGSHIPLLAWFRVVVSLLVNPDICLDDLSPHTTVVRRATLRKMVRRVSDALASPDAAQQLAGLPNYAFDYLRKVSRRANTKGAQLRDPAANLDAQISRQITNNSAQRRQNRRPR